MAETYTPSNTQPPSSYSMPNNTELADADTLKTQVLKKFADGLRWAKEQVTAILSSISGLETKVSDIKSGAKSHKSLLIDGQGDQTVASPVDGALRITPASSGTVPEGVLYRDMIPYARCVGSTGATGITSAQNVEKITTVTAGQAQVYLKGMPAAYSTLLAGDDAPLCCLVSPRGTNSANVDKIRVDPGIVLDGGTLKILVNIIFTDANGTGVNTGFSMMAWV